MRIYFASDHAGFELKGKLIPFVESLGHECIDKGDFAADAGDDYPDFIALAASEVSRDKTARAILIGGSGQGEAVLANRFPNVRAALYYGGNSEIVKLSRDHNDSNVLSFGSRFLTEEEAKDTIKMWLDTPFSGDERHIRRIKKIDHIRYQ